MHILTNWKIKRAGPAMTIHATDAAGQAVKIVGVDEVSFADGKIIATESPFRAARRGGYPASYLLAS